MNKMNKKGFTLIEMLVVIAIIAVLVSIIIPVVADSTEKAAAAANAANLRSMTAEVNIQYMTGDKSAITDGANWDGPAAKECGNANGGETPVIDITEVDGKVTNIEVTYGDGLTIAYFAGLAGDGSDATTGS